MNARSPRRRPPATRALRAIAVFALGALPLGNPSRCWAFDHARDPVFETATGRPWTPTDGRPARVTFPDRPRPDLSQVARTATSTPAPAGDELWWDGFGLPDIDGWVNCA